MTITTAEELAQRALDLGLVQERDLQHVLGELGGRNIELAELRKELEKRGLLTFFQSEHLIAEDRTSFYYGDYKVLYLVGTGSFARVYRATNPHTDEIVAIKVLRKRFSESKEEAQRFFREGKMVMALDHPNIVPIYDVASEGQSHYLVIEFIEGQSLREFLKVRKVCSVIEASKIMLDVADGLEYAANQGIHHRDLKLSNVLVSSRGVAKLVDFGLASANKNISDEMLMKNPNPRAIDYVGLERATGVGKNDPRSDTFFVGCMYYQMLTGKSPLTVTKDRMQRLRKGRFQDITPISQINPDIPGDIVTVVNKAICFAPERRYQTPGEMAVDLREVLKNPDRPEPKLPGDADAASEQEVEDAKPALEGVDSFGNPRKLLIVESDMKMQDFFRERLKQYGYRVMLMNDAQRAFDRFKNEFSVADIAVFSTGKVGEAGLEAYNALGEDQQTKQIPAVLLLSKEQMAWKERATLCQHRIVLSMPIKLRELRQSLVQIVAASAS